MHGSPAACGAATAVFFMVGVCGSAEAATVEPRPAVRGTEVTTVQVRAAGGSWRAIAWEDLDRTAFEPGRYELRFEAHAEGEGGSVELPQCAGRGRVRVDGRDAALADGPEIVAIATGVHDIEIVVDVSAYERRIACGDRPRYGRAESSTDGLAVLTFPSPSSERGGGRAVLFLPPGHDRRAPAPLLVGLHPWNGSMWTYASYAQLLREAAARGVVVLLPSGLGNSLYTADAEDEVLRAMAAASEVVAVDRSAVTLWGASMGGAGATTIGLHHPDRFARVVSLFGDSRYDRKTYVRAILRDDAAAHRVNALDVVDNARNLPVWLIHGASDRTSPVYQSEILASALAARGFSVRFDRVPDAGHSGALVARFLPDIVAAAAASRIPAVVTRVSYRSVRPSDTGAYGVAIVRAAATGDAFVDVERRDDAVHVLRAEGVRRVLLARGALGADPDRPPPIVVDAAAAAAPAIDARWEGPP